MKYDAIIFDLDGTLWNANESCTEKLDYKDRITTEEMNSVTGRPIDDCIDLLLPGIRNKYADIKELLTIAEK
jgi:phosphoglycolate phosphatase-like HAD superfamily hydrolase